jgi:hypothetical protein
MREILVATKKEGIRELLDQEKNHSCPQYDSFIRIGGDIGELL